MKNFKSAEAFCRFLWHNYLIKNNKEGMDEFLDSCMTEIGTGLGQYCQNSEEFLSCPEYPSESGYVIEKEWYEMSVLGENLFLVSGEIKLSLRSISTSLPARHLRFSMITELREGSWKLLHLHQSVPDFRQKDKKNIYYSQFDYLTDLMSRRCMEENISRLMLQKAAGILITMDIDNFKTYNDKYGHPFGDQILISIAKSLLKTFPKEINGRIGGDEFVTYIPCSSIHKNKLSESLEQFFQNWTEYQKKFKLQNHIYVSVGIGFYPEHGNDFHSLWSNADRALYFAKRKGKNHICYCSELPGIEEHGRT
ncbi:GGDEF domain-containing protein [Anaerostipes sp.]|uniref:GGDEF domain-containing protein n=1 Tax=Anaerostipes sp. TaxID=1872530 RepID=UPI0025C3CE14|nr:GGDEF domain-containing protein [Anaerostipes sp.]MBS7008569.1 diguanylate cyclase [Anaerostipes sp.]